MSKEISNHELGFSISEKGLKYGETIFKPYTVYEALEHEHIKSHFTRRSDDLRELVERKIDDLKEGKNEHLLLIYVGNNDYFVLMPIQDIKTKKSITIYTHKDNIGNIIGTGGSNIQCTLIIINRIIDDSKLKFIKVEEERRNDV